MEGIQDIVSPLKIRGDLVMYCEKVGFMLD